VLGASALLVSLTCAGCRRAEAPPSSERRATPSSLATPYPPGRWRQAPQAEIDRTLLWASHILIRHRDVPPGIVAFQPRQWTPEPPAPARTREQAFALAERLATELQRDPTRFASMAREYSEDIVTRDTGGRLGVLRPLVSAFSPEVLDALEALGPEQVSRVVETAYGFHVLLHQAPPPERTVSGARIVIGYDEAPWLARHLARRPIPPRSRAEALALARRIQAELERQPGAFARLVEQYSEHRDALRQGDFGAWSTREPTPIALEVDTLLGLEVGQIAPPRDTLFGIQIIQRTPDRRRQRLAMARAELGFNPRLPDADPDSEASVLARARHIAELVHADPKRLSELHAEVCCAGVWQWTEGQGNVFYEQRLLQLPIGASTSEPVRSNEIFAVLQRLEPDARAPAVRLELP
jgi:hypothetical protein